MARTLTIRLPEQEAALLAAYAKKTKRTRSEIVRSFIRSLARKAELRRPRP
jgi:predicted DNA-binding protein